MNGKKVLLIDDDIDFLKLTQRIFERVGAQVFTAKDGVEGINSVLNHQPNLIMLDIMMPGQDGFQVCKLIRKLSNTPLVMVSALDQDQLMMQGLEAGADDFITKPISPDILIARVEAVLRRSERDDGYQPVNIYDDGHLRVEIDKHRVHVGNQPVNLTPVEFRLLAYLVSNAGKAMTFKQILFNVWGSEYQGSDEYVHVYISHLRGKIEEKTRSPRYLHTIHGIGYLFEAQENTASS